MADTQESGAQPARERVVIKKYANRRLYNTASSSYVTLEHLAEMVKKGVDFVVYDAKTNDDITRTVLTQIIFEEEEKSQGQSLLPIQFLRQLISFYGDSMQAFLPSYLELSLASFTQQQERLRGQLAAFKGPGVPLGVPLAGGLSGYEDQIRQNLALFDQAMKMFSPFALAAGAPSAPAGSAARAADAAPASAPAASQAAPMAAPPAADEALSQLRRQMAEMQAQIDKLGSKG